jgi:hypothetical protein
VAIYGGALKPKKPSGEKEVKTPEGKKEVLHEERTLGSSRSTYKKHGCRAKVTPGRRIVFNLKTPR